MNNSINELLKRATHNLDAAEAEKRSFIPMPGGVPQGGGQAPMDPAMAGGAPMDPGMGGMPMGPSMGGAPMDPSMGGAPMDPSMGGMPMDPSMGGMPMDPSMGGMPMDPGMMGGPPMDPTGGMPPEPGAGGGEEQLYDLMVSAFRQVLQESGGAPGGGGQKSEDGEGSKKQTLSQRVSELEGMLEAVGITSGIEGVGAAGGMSSGSGSPSDAPADEEPMPAPPMGPLDPASNPALSQMGSAGTNLASRQGAMVVNAGLAESRKKSLDLAFDLTAGKDG